MTNNPLPAALASIKRYSFEYVQGVPAMLRRDDGEFWKVHEVLPHLPPPADGAVAWTQQGCLDEIRKRTNGSTEIICWPTPDDDYNVTLYAAPPAERIEKLEREKQLHAGDTLSLSNELNEWKERAQDAEHALAEARRDAERYAYIRKFQCGSGRGELPSGGLWEEFDAAIDAASRPEKDANNG